MGSLATNKTDRNKCLALFLARLLLPTCQRQFWPPPIQEAASGAVKCATLHACPLPRMPASSLGIIQLTWSKEREDGLAAKCSLNTDSERRSCKVLRAQIFSSSLSRLCYVATMPVHRGTNQVNISFKRHTALTLLKIQVFFIDLPTVQYHHWNKTSNGRLMSLFNSS